MTALLSCSCPGVEVGKGLACTMMRPETGVEMRWSPARVNGRVGDRCLACLACFSFGLSDSLSEAGS